MQCPERTVVQGKGDNGDKNVSQNNYYIFSSSNFFERGLHNTFAEVTTNFLENQKFGNTKILDNDRRDRSGDRS